MVKCFFSSTNPAIFLNVAKSFFFFCDQNPNLSKKGITLSIIELGFEEALGHHAMVIEWPERLGEVSLGDVLPVTITIAEDDARLVTIAPDAESRWSAVLESAPDFA